MMPRRVLVTGASGQLGAYLLENLAREHAFDVTAWSGTADGERSGVHLRPVDMSRPEIVEAAFRDAHPEIVLHAAAISRVDLCHAHADLAERINVQGTRQLARLAQVHRARLLYVSTDLVFDGESAPYREQDHALPASCYGRSKLAGENAVLDIADAVVARVSLLFGPSRSGKPSFFDQQCLALREGRPLTLFTDEWRTPLSLITAAHALVALAASDVTGIVHVGGPQRMSRWEMGQRLATSQGHDPSLLCAGRQSDATFPEPRPRDVSLDSSRWRSLFPTQPWPEWDEAVAELGVTL